MYSRHKCMFVFCQATFTFRLTFLLWMFTEAFLRLIENRSFIYHHFYNTRSELGLGLDKKNQLPQISVCSPFSSLWGFNHPLLSLPVLDHAHPMPVGVSSQNAFCRSSVKVDNNFAPGWRCMMSVSGSLWCWSLEPHTVNLLHLSSHYVDRGVCLCLLFSKLKIRSLVLLTLSSKLFFVCYFARLWISSRYKL